MNVAWVQSSVAICIIMLHGVCFGEEAGARNLFFSGKAAAAGDERQLACAAGAGWARRSSQCKCWFDVFCVFLRFAVAWCFGSFGCTTHCNGCMNVAWVQSSVAVCIVMAA